MMNATITRQHRPWQVVVSELTEALKVQDWADAARVCMEAEMIDRETCKHTVSHARVECLGRFVNGERFDLVGCAHCGAETTRPCQH